MTTKWEAEQPPETKDFPGYKPFNGPTLPFVEWYADVATNDAEMIWAKAKKYGGLTIVQDALATMFGRVGVNDEQVLALLVALKLSRIVEALGAGEKPDEDSWRDLACYAMMARRVRRTGSWPA